MWERSIDHNMDVQYQRTDVLKQGCIPWLAYSISCSIAAMLHDAVIVIARTRPRAILRGMMTMMLLPFIDFCHFLNNFLPRVLGRLYLPQGIVTVEQTHGKQLLCLL